MFTAILFTKTFYFYFLNFYLYFYFYVYFILLYNTVLVLPYIDMNPPRVYTHSQTWTPLPPPSPYHPLGHPSAPALSILSHASNIDWRFISHMILYMFQCHSPKSSHPLPLPLSPKVCYTYLCLFCCLAYRVVITIFLNYVCVSILYWCFSFWLTSLCIIGSSFIHLIRTDSNEFFLTAE